MISDWLWAGATVTAAQRLVLPLSNDTLLRVVPNMRSHRHKLSMPPTSMIGRFAAIVAAARSPAIWKNAGPSNYCRTVKLRPLLLG